jgi:multidrug efflux pump
MKSFNLSDWALKHRSLVWYFMIAFMMAGLFAYLQLGRQEDPDFTIKTMVIQAQWPGASAEEVTRQVTDRIEKKLEELESLDYTKSVTVAGQTTVFVYLRDSTKASDVAPTWVRVRNMIADIKGDLPQGVIGPGFNDRFGDVFGNIYAFTSDGLTLRQLRDQVEDIRAKILTVPNVGKVDILGAQDEVIYLEFSTRKIAALGLDSSSIMASLQAQNAVTPSGVFQAGAERISVRVSGEFASEASLKAINLRINDRFFPLTDVATITRGYVDPPTTLVRFNGEPAIALAIGMKSGANLLKFGVALKRKCPRSSPISRSGWESIWWRINRWSSNTPCRGSPKRCSRRWSSSLQSASLASGFERVSWLRSRYRWFSPSRSSSWPLRVFRCSAFPWAR